MINMDLDLEVQGVCVWCSLFAQLLQNKDGSAAMCFSVCEALASGFKEQKWGSPLGMRGGSL